MNIVNFSDSGSASGNGQTEALFEKLKADRSNVAAAYLGARKAQLLADILEGQAFYQLGGFNDPFLAGRAKWAGLPTEGNPAWVFSCLVSGFDPALSNEEKRKRRKLASEHGAFIGALGERFGVDTLISMDAEEILNGVERAGGKTAFTRSQVAANAVDSEERPDTSAAALAAIVERANQAPTLATFDAGSLPSALPGSVIEALLVVGDDGAVQVKHVLDQNPEATKARLLPVDVTQFDPVVRAVSDMLNLARVIPEGTSNIARDLGADPSAEGVALLPALRQFLWIDRKFHVSQARVDMPTVVFEAAPREAQYFPGEPSFIESKSRRRADEALAPQARQGLFKVGQLVVSSERKHPALEFQPVKGGGAKAVALSLPPIAQGFGSSAVADMWAFRLNEAAFKPTPNCVLDEAELARLGQKLVNPNLAKVVGKEARVEVSAEAVSLKVGTSEPLVLKAVAVATENTAINVAASDLIAVLATLLGFKLKSLAFAVDPGGLLAIVCSTDVADYRVFLPKATKQDKVLIRTHGDRLRRVTRDNI